MNIPIVDSHVHLWDPERFRMSWTDDETLLKQAYSLEKYKEQTKNLPIEAMIFMECGVDPQYSFLEARWAVQCTRQEPRLQGVVAAAPVEFGAQVQSYLEALAELGPMIKGVRRNIQDVLDLNYCLQPGFIQGIKLAARYQFTFDLCIRHWQLPAVIQLVSQCPKTQFVLDHLGKPSVRTQTLDPWRQHIQTLASFPNVFCKISGLVTEADPDNWSAGDLISYIDHIWETFGEDRVMFAGDWPVVLLTSTYERWFETVRTYVSSLSLTAQQKFWQGNARHFYHLETLES